MKSPYLETEKFNYLSHLFGASISLLITIILMPFIKGDAKTKFIGSILGFGTTLVLTGSFIYHFKKKEENEVSLWRKLDHFGIFVSLACTFTPVCYLYLTGAWKITIISGLWIFVVLGILFKIYFIDAPRWIGAGIYLVMGLLVLIPINPLLTAMPNDVELFLWLGIFFILAGVAVYITKKPNPKFVGFHGVWHLLVLTSNVMAFILNYKIFL